MRVFSWVPVTKVTVEWTFVLSLAMSLLACTAPERSWGVENATARGGTSTGRSSTNSGGSSSQGGHGATTTSVTNGTGAGGGGGSSTTSSAGGGGGSSAGGGGASSTTSCTPGAKQCAGLQPQTCDVSGVWQSDGTACAYICTASACTGSCAPGAKQCSGRVPQTCDGGGQWKSADAACSAGEICSLGACVVTPSCAGGATGQVDCGPTGVESCCLSLMVPGGTVALDASHTATVSDYELDKYEVTVGRFRAFVDAWVGGWRPEPGSGKHTHLIGGAGLSNGSDGYEPGWDTAWSASLASTTVDWDANLSCSGKYQSWTSSAAGNERRPINCATWFEMAAFCTWDGGFLPSEAEWQYAAAGGSENRLYPWGATEPMNTLAVFCGGSCESSENVGSHPDGNGRWGHSDLAGNVWEWALDGYQTPYPLSMTTNYANMMSMSRVIRSGSFSGSASDLLTSLRSGLAPSVRNFDLGARCARVP